MLQAIRDRATGWIAWAIIILICIPFALWGIQEFATPERSLVVARVNDTEIGYYQYRSAYQQQRERLQQMLGGAIPDELLADGRLRRQTLEYLINDEILVQTAVGNGLRVGDGQLASAIRTLPGLQSGASFSQQAYDSFLRARGTNAQAFELDLRRSMLSEQVVSALSRSEIVTNQEVDAAMRIRNEQRRFRLLRIEPSAMEVPDPTAEEIERWFETNSERYVQPERVKVRYLELDRSTIAADIPADDAELEAIYAAERDNYRTPEQREARHILVNLTGGASEEEVEQARKKIEALRERIVAGEDFAAVAAEGSEDPGSASIGGALGSFARGVMDPAFEDVAFSLEPGELSEPVRSRFGWHLIEITKIEPESVRSFEEARADLLFAYRSRQAEQLFADQAERLATLGFEHPESLEAAAAELGLTPRETDFFSRAGNGATGIAARPALREAAFSDDVLAGGNNSELVQLGPDRVVLLRVIEREDPRPRTLDEVREEIRTLLRRDAAAQQASATGERILERLRSGTSLEEAVQREGLEWSAERSVTRAAPGELAPDVVEALYAIDAPAKDDVAFGGTSLVSGAYVVIAVHEVGQSALEPERNQDVREQIARRLEAGYGEQVLSTVMRRMREAADVQVLEQNLRPEEG